MSAPACPPDERGDQPAPGPEEIAAARLVATEGLGRVGLGRLLEEHPEPVRALAALRRRRGVSIPDEAPLAAMLRARGTRVWWRGHPDFPIPTQMPDCPAVLFAEGDRPESLCQPSVAIVGTRAATPHGRADAEVLARTLGAAGICVVSGLAIGIDAAAHRGAVAVGGATVAVVGTGTDVVYPRHHGDLDRAVRRHGLVISEQPFGRGPQRWLFPIRNRIIVMLAAAVVVVESRAKGGALSTAEWAMRYDVPVLALPGSRRNPAAAGTNALLADGAHPLLDPTDVLGALGRIAPATGWQAAGPGATGPGAPTASLSAQARQLLRALGGDATSFDELAGRARLPVAAVAGGLRELERAGRIVRERGLIWPA